MKEKEKLEKDLKKLKSRFEKGKQQDEDKGTSRVKNSKWFAEQFKAISPLLPPPPRPRAAGVSPGAAQGKICSEIVNFGVFEHPA